MRNSFLIDMFFCLLCLSACQCSKCQLGCDRLKTELDCKEAKMKAQRCEIETAAAGSKEAINFGALWTSLMALSNNKGILIWEGTVVSGRTFA